jgi:hypothetical protein
LIAERDTEFTIKFPGELESVGASISDKLEASEYGDNYRNIILRKGEVLELEVVLR